MEQPKASSGSAYPWVLLALTTAFWGLVGINRLGITYLFPKIVPEFHMNLTEAGLLISGTSFTWAITTWLSGWLSDHFGRRRVLIPGAALACLATAAMGGAWNFISMFIIRDLVGIGDGVGWPNSQAALHEEFGEKRRAMVSGIFTSGYALFGSVLGALIVTRLAVALGWRAVFPIIAAVFAIVVVLLFVFMRESRPAAARPAKITVKSAVSVARSKNVLLLMAVQVGALSWLQVGVGYNTLFLTRVKHVSLVEAGTILAIAGLAGWIGTLVLPPMSDIVGRKVAITAGGVLSAVLLALYAFGNFPLPLSVAFLAANGFCIGVIIPLAAATSVVELVREEQRATAMGAINFVGALGGTFVMPLVAGVVADHFGLGAAQGIAAGSALVAGLLMLGTPETAPRVLARRAAAREVQPEVT